MPMEKLTETAIIVSGCALIIVVLLLIGWLIYCLIGKHRKNSTRSYNAVHDAFNLVAPQELYYTADNFEHKGPLCVKKEAHFNGQVSNPETDEDNNPPDAHFTFTDSSHKVFDINSQIEIVR
ncbi:hypothetical protein M3Y97_00198700 [Aphelenchoides bicaudatus]|nr:hypothetical protein M3Y97_00198700 [Aphelenchoides bicaudatus]